MDQLITYAVAIAIATSAITVRRIVGMTIVARHRHLSEKQLDAIVQLSK